MAFVPKNWVDKPSTTTPINATALEDLEVRVTDYADEVAGSGGDSNVFIQETQPTGLTAPALWIPLDESGDPMPITEWQVFTP